MIAVSPIEDTLLGGKYAVSKGDQIAMMIKKSHIDPNVYGEDATEFKPERMLDGKFEKLPKNAWKPFGNGVRGCIGRPFAWQEALLVMAMLLQNFNFVMDDPSYNIAYKQTLTIKPLGFHMRAILRDNLTPTTLEKRLAGHGPDESQAAEAKAATAVQGDGQGKPMTILYGGNSGTCEGLSQKLATTAAGHGFYATVTSLDAAVEKVGENENKKEDREEGTDVKDESIPPVGDKPEEHVNRANDEEKSKITEGGLPGLKDNLGGKEAEASDNKDKEGQGTKLEDKTEQPEDEAKKENRPEELKELETDNLVEKKVEVEGEHKDISFRTEEKVGAKENEGYHNGIEVSKKGEAEVTDNGTNGSGTGEVDAPRNE